MRIRRAIISALKADGTVAGLVGARVVPEWASDETAAPYVGVSVVSHGHFDALDATALDIEDVRLDVNLWAATEADRGALWAAIYAALHNLHHVTVDGVELLSVRLQRTTDIAEVPRHSGRPLLRSVLEIRVRGRLAA